MGGLLEDILTLGFFFLAIVAIILVVWTVFLAPIYHNSEGYKAMIENKTNELIKRCAMLNMSNNKLGSELGGSSTCKNETHVCEISSLENERFDVFNCKRVYWVK